MREFNLEKAKAGKPVCTRGGNPVRIISFDRKSVDNDFPIVALVSTSKDNEFVDTYRNDGRYLKDTSISDLMMVSEKHEGFINIYNINGAYCAGDIYNTKEEAKQYKDKSEYITTIKIEWEE